MNEYLEREFAIRSSEVDIYGLLRPSALMGFLQDMATEHSAAQHIEQAYLTREYHAAWILVRAWFRLERPLRQNEVLTVRTWHRGAGGLIVYRDYDLWAGGEPVGEAVAAWVVADVETRRMLRPKQVAGIARASVPETVKTRQLKLIRSPKEKQAVYTKTVRYSDLDLNGHMNNTKYADVAMDALDHRELAGKYLREMQLNYSQECTAGESVQVYRAAAGGGVYIDGCGVDGARRFEALLEFAPDPDSPLDEQADSE